MKREIRGRRLLITGATGAIGRSLAEQAARAGARLALVARNQDRLDDLAATLRSQGAEAHVIPADITSEADRARLLESAVSSLGGLDVLINNAGIGAWGHFASSSEDVMRQVMEVNFFAPVELIRLAVPYLERGQQPAVVNVSSICGRLGLPAWPEYSASKFALSGISEALRGELCRYDIDLLLIVPGHCRNVDRQLIRSEGRYPLDYEKGMAPEKVASAILGALRSGGFETVVGSDARWLIRFNRFFPRLFEWLVGRRIKKLYATGA